MSTPPPGWGPGASRNEGMGTVLPRQPSSVASKGGPYCTQQLGGGDGDRLPWWGGDRELSSEETDPYPSSLSPSLMNGRIGGGGWWGRGAAGRSVSEAEVGGGE